jgi:electron transfer flavoprotein beta subunit
VKIAVCVKQVPEAGSARRIDPQTKRLDRSGEAALNAFDVNAVEEALRLKETTGDAEVVVLSMGPAGALDALRKALAMGADRATHWTARLQGYDAMIILADGRVLSTPGFGA